MRIRKNSLLGWTIHILVAATMGWIFGYMLLPGISAQVFNFILPILARMTLGVTIGVLYLYCFRNDIDTAFPFKNGGWLK